MTKKSITVEALQRQLAIEAALERVRARSMAMESSEELSDVLSVLFQQFDLLGIAPKTAWLTLWNPEENTFTYRSTGTSGLRIQGQQVLDIDGMEIWRALYDKWKTDTSDSVEVLHYSKEDLGQLFSLLEETYSAMPEEERLTPEHFPDGGYSVQGHCKYGYIGYTHTREPAEEDKAILTRFATEFGRTYQRFLDIQKAEAQAREAQIEAALERVRARSMAMRHSSELGDVAAVLFDQMNQLLGELWTCGFVLCEKGREEDEWWLSMDGGFTRGFFLPNVGDTTHATLYEGWVKGDDFRTVQLEGASLQWHYDWLMQIPTARNIFEDMEASGIKRPEWQKLHAAYFSKGYLCIITEVPCEEEAVFKRFAQAFDLAYTRFLDLQKAEAQAREAQIETALERVRSRSMAMHNTSELQDVINTVYRQFLDLRVDISGGAFIVINSDIDTEVVCWGAGGTADYIEKIHLPFMDMPIYTELVKGIQKGPGFFKEFYSEEEKKQFFKELFRTSPYNESTDSHKKEVLSRPGGYARSCHVSPHTSIFIVNHHGRPFTEEENEILKRMGKVFEQSYTRFLDLQKAEAQAREAQIEAALERVRARSMAMHGTEELADVLCVLLEQFDLLDINPVLTHLTLFDAENETFSLRITTSPENRILSEQIIDVNAMDAWKASFQHWKDTESGAVDCIDYTPDMLPGVFGLMDELIQSLPKQYRINADDFPNGLYTTQGRFDAGFIGFNHTRRATEEEKEIVKRLAAEFGRVYQRFLDLKRAEAQTREAEIETALERVRAASMAMHNSSELYHVINILSDQLARLGITMDAAMINEKSKASKDWYMWLAIPSVSQEVYTRKDKIHVPYLRSAAFDRIYRAEKEGKSLFSDQLTKDQKDLVFRHYFKNSNHRDVPEARQDFILSCPGLSRTTVLSENSFIQFYRYSLTEFTEGENQVLERFGKVFEQSYTRFLDLQKAEAQAREAEIQLSLERIRARTMAMQESAELTEVLSVVFQQLNSLGVDTVWTHLTLLHLEENAFTYRMTGRNGERIMAEEKIALDASEHWAHISDALKSPDTEPDPITRFEIPPDGLDAIWELFDGIFSKLPEGEKVSPDDFPNGLFTTQAYCKFGFLGLNQTREATEEEADILLRFTTEFSRLYQRFLDLQNAEKRAREAEVEMALERVRSRTMAMHKSEELGEVAAVLFEQIDSLGATLERLNIGIVREEEAIIEWWSTEQGGRQINQLFKGSIDEPTTIAKVYRAWKDGAKRLVIDQTGPELRKWIRYVTEVIGLPFDPKLIQERRVHSAAFFKHGALLVSTPEPLPAGSINLLERFSAVFEQTYTRFLDLQKAEQQAREAEIEAALERVRAKTMAMHNTDDIADTVVTFFEELIGLGLDDTMRAGIGILSQSEQMKVWTASVPGTAKTILHSGFLDMSSHPLLQGVKRTWRKGDPHFTYVLKGEDLNAYFQNLNDAPGYDAEFDLRKLPETIYHRSIPFRDGVLFAFTEVPLPEDIISTLERFAAVFGQTYTRYLDLQKAEARARESRIEAALERVRAKALAMHSSEDLRQTITTTFEELDKLEIQFIRVGLGLLNPDKPEGEIITSRIGENGAIIEVGGTFHLVGHPVLNGVYDHFKRQVDYFPVLKGGEINSYYAALTRSVDVQGYGTDETHYGCFLYFPEGGFYTWAAHPYSETQIEILKKFSRVVEITYRRYNDLIESEAREKEAIKQASLDRVRAEIASMRTTEDLERITPLIWKELTTLGIPFFRCGVFIMDEAGQMVHVYLTTPEGEALAVMDLPFDFDMSLIQKGVDHWRKQESLVEKWDQSQFIEMTKKLMEHGQVKSATSYQAGEKPPERLVLHQVPFAQGMLYLGSAEMLSAEEMEIVQALTRTFAVAYARYEDFKELEKAKRKVENTLADLKATQAQLIQSEKMASLGELTAGIAHEIKNPLNFVNNFSEVSHELLEELLEEMDKGDWEEVRALAGDVIQNLEKIVHHGQRADSIVKGMLQHSRSGDGQKEPTDLNELTDEYVRLAYHGLRAKDKSFNVTLETDFDKGIGKIDVIPQDLGRVLLNLLTNAFHAVNEKKAAATEAYDPSVWVRTKKTTQGVEVTVRDNGGGIPDTIVDKIFQPFFTTKPTGQGTGLGLSLSYDIVKAHGGELSVETKEGDGTTFRITFKTNS